MGTGDISMSYCLGVSSGIIRYYLNVRLIFDVNLNMGFTRLILTLSRNIDEGTHFPTPYLRIHLILPTKTLTYQLSLCDF